MTMDMKILGTNIKKLRENAGLGQKHLAGYLGVDQSLISKFESGERAVSSDMLDKLAALFCCSPAAMMSPGGCEASIGFAFRTAGIEEKDLEALTVINKIALNQMQMDKMAGGTKHDR